MVGKKQFGSNAAAVREAHLEQAGGLREGRGKGRQEIFAEIGERGQGGNGRHWHNVVRKLDVYQARIWVEL